MKNARKSPRLAWHLACLVALSSLLSGCGLLMTATTALESDGVRPEKNEVVVGGTWKKVGLDADLAGKFALMALFAKVTYRQDLPLADRNSGACAYLQPQAKVEDFGMPHQVVGGRRTGWKRWIGTPEAPGCFNKAGLSYEVYVHETSGGSLDEAVIAFRGTENDSLRDIFLDWGTNFSALFAIEPPQYAAAQRWVPKVVAALKAPANSSGIKIYATGHSLGGGLAQQAGYLSSDILEVFAFNTSPVTNWSALAYRDAEASRNAPQARVIQNDYPKIHRVYHRREGLAYAREVTSRLNGRRLKRRDYEFFFQDEKLVASHEMGILACHFAKLVQDREAEHHYPGSYARQVIGPDYYKTATGNHPVCPAERVKLAD
jgi:hypothetical protein